MNQRSLVLELLPKPFAVAKLDAYDRVPEWAQGEFVSVTRTPAELSVICAAALVPPEVTAQRGFRCLRVQGPLAFTEVGILESLATPLGGAGISIFVLSTYETDYLLLPEAELEAGLSALAVAGHTVHRLGAA